MYQENFYIGDFRKYTDEGFIISPGLDGFEYNPIGIINITSKPGYTPKLSYSDIDKKDVPINSIYSISSN